MAIGKDITKLSKQDLQECIVLWSGEMIGQDGRIQTAELSTAPIKSALLQAYSAELTNRQSTKIAKWALGIAALSLVVSLVSVFR